MRKNALVLCLSTSILSAFGIFFRWLQNLNVFDEDTGLATEGATASTALVVVSIISLGIILYLVLRLKKFYPTKVYTETITGQTLFFEPVAYLASLIMAAGAVMLIVTAGSANYPGLLRWLGLMFIASALAVAGLVLGSEKTKYRNMVNLASVVLILIYCFWLIVSYKEWSADPVIWSFAIEIIAISMSAYGFYLLAGYAFGFPKPFMTIFILCVAGFFDFMTLSDNCLVGKQLIFGATGVILLVFATVITENLKMKRPTGKPLV